MVHIENVAESDGTVQGVMALQQRESKNAKCPFYRKESRLKVYCEGFVSHSGVHMAFGDPEGCLAWRRKYCNDGYVDCPLAEALYEKKYNEEKRP